jgi:hypothetical protein
MGIHTIVARLCLSLCLGVVHHHHQNAVPMHIAAGFMNTIPGSRHPLGSACTVRRFAHAWLICKWFWITSGLLRGTSSRKSEKVNHTDDVHYGCVPYHPCLCQWDTGAWVMSWDPQASRCSCPHAKWPSLPPFHASSDIAVRTKKNTYYASACAARYASWPHLP